MKLRKKRNAVKLRKELLGVVGVDSGHLLITDPIYIRSQWLHKGNNPPVIRFWGQAAKHVASKLQDIPLDIVFKNGVYELTVYNNLDDLCDLIHSFAGDEPIAVQVINDSPIDKVFDVADNEKQGGQVNYPLGHPGLGVVFQSGLGDGVYEVWAYYDDIEGWGERIVKVEVILIPEQDS